MTVANVVENIKVERLNVEGFSYEEQKKAGQNDCIGFGVWIMFGECNRSI